MTRKMQVAFELPKDLTRLRFPKAVDRRLHDLLDRQGQVGGITPEERREAEGLVDLATLITLLRLKVERALAEAKTHGQEMASAKRQTPAIKASATRTRKR